MILDKISYEEKGFNQKVKRHLSFMSFTDKETYFLYLQTHSHHLITELSWQ